jgi:hypothetical protein
MFSTGARSSSSGMPSNASSNGAVSNSSRKHLTGNRTSSELSRKHNGYNPNPLAPLRPSALCLDSSGNRSTPGGSAYRKMQESFASNTTTTTTSLEDSQETRLNSHSQSDENNFVTFVAEVNNNNTYNYDIPSDSDEESPGVSGTVVQDTQDFNETQIVLPAATQPASTQSSGPPEWENIPPDAVIKQLKSLSPEILYSSRLREFYKSYPIWAKMTPEQKNKSVAWYRTLPVEVQGIYRFLLFFGYKLICFSFLIFPFFSNHNF